MDLKRDIKHYANSIGIDLIGFTSAEPFEDIRDILEFRKSLGYLSGFEEKDIDLRINPKKTMTNAESIIAIALSYYNEPDDIKNDKSKFCGKLSRIAWGMDYHIVLREKLEKIAKFIKNKKMDFEYKAFVDTGPLVDRQVAYRAGLGYYGYNSVLINDKYGSWIVIGYMITNLQIEADYPLIDKRCYGCNLCIKNCPTGAIEGAYKFNADKCISNILQQKKEIRGKDRPVLENKIYGCDICQEVCPHNKKIEHTSEDRFSPVKLSPMPDLIELLNIPNKKFKETYGMSSAGWRGKKILQRNAIIALVNHKDKDAIPYLQELLKDSRSEIREYALWGINILQDMD